MRLKGAYIVKCTRYETDEAGNVTTVYCTYDPESHSGEGQRKVKGTLHWLSKEDAVPAEFRLYEDLLLPETPENAQLDFTQRLNPDSMVKKAGLCGACPGCLRPWQPVSIHAGGGISVPTWTIPLQPPYSTGS